MFKSLTKINNRLDRTVIGFLFLLGLVSYYFTIETIDKYKTIHKAPSTISYTQEIPEGGSVFITRAFGAEPAGCRASFKIFVSPVFNLDRIFMIDHGTRTSISQHEIQTNKHKLTDIPPGKYFYWAEALIFCNIIDDILGGIPYNTTPILITIIPKAAKENP